MLERCEEVEEEKFAILEMKGDLLKIGCTLFNPGWVELIELNARPLTVVDALEVSRQDATGLELLKVKGEPVNIRLELLPVSVKGPEL